MLLTGVRGDVNSAFGVYKMSNASCVHGNNELLSMTQGIKGEHDSDNLLLSSTEYIVDLFLRTGYLFQFIIACCSVVFSLLWQSLPQQREEHDACISTGFSIH